MKEIKEFVISVIVPVYGAEDYLAECLNSILHQSYEALELILVDDGSKDRCPKICDEYAKKDHRVIVIHQNNSGVSTARNTGLKIATGKYIGFVDADDTIDLMMYETMLKKMNKDNSQICVCTEQVYQGKVLENCSLRGDCLEKEEAVRELLGMNFPTSICSCLYERDILGGVCLNSKIHYWEDYEFQLRALDRADRISLCRFPGYHYRQREGSANHQPLNGKILSGMKVPMFAEAVIRQNYPKYLHYARELYGIFLINLIGYLANSPKVERRFYRRITSYSRKYLPYAMRSKKLTFRQKFYVLICFWDSKLFWKMYQAGKRKKKVGE